MYINEIVFLKFCYLLVYIKSICFIDVFNYGVEVGFVFGVGDIGDFVVGVVEYGLDKVVQFGVYVCKDGRGGLFNDIYLCKEVVGFVYYEFVGFKYQFEVFVVFFVKFIEMF